MITLEDHRVILLTDRGMSAVAEVATIIHEADRFDGLAGYGDVWNACRRVIKDLRSKCMRPDHGAEYVDITTQIVCDKICAHTFVAPLLGITLNDIDGLALGSFQVVHPSFDYINGLGLACDADRVKRFVEHTKSYHWLTGSVRGTDVIAKRNFPETAQLATGILAIFAASSFNGGAHGFRIGIAMSPEEMYGPATYLSWLETDKWVINHSQSTRAQHFEVDEELRGDIETSNLGKRAFRIIESQNRTDLEEAIVRAIYWYSDAHRDESAVMRLLKYWSCVEALFSCAEEQITKSVSAGLAAMLTHGSMGFCERMEFPSLKRRIARLYAQRSKATHRAAYQHVSDKDASDLSQWVAWLILNAIAFVDQGATTCMEVKQWASQIDSQYLILLDSEPQPGL